MKKILLIIFDGLADRPIKELGDKTPLDVAKTPNLDRLTFLGAIGTQNALSKKEYPTSEESHFEIFGYEHIGDMPGRGVLEALGLGVPVGRGELALRVNFATVDENLKVLDPRAGNIKDNRSFSELVKEEKINQFNFRLYPGLAHRAALVVSGGPVSSAINHHSTIVTDTDPHKAKNHLGGDRVIRPSAVDNKAESVLTAETLWKYQLLTHNKLNSFIENKVRKRQGLLPVNFLLTRGAGFKKEVDSFYEKYKLNAACVAGAPLYKGIAKYFGMDVVDVPGATGGVDTNIDAKVKKSTELLRSGYDFVFMHLKGADVVAEEDGDFEAKIKFFEKADKAFSDLTRFQGIICITGDHATPCILKDHSADEVPILIVGEKSDQVQRFTEKESKNGSLGHIKGKEIMPKLINEAKNV
ncbi:MAG: 2,3-bisphosphoglycerate-independent phosphoglycerate mutase [Patescibacteria group bacterium]|nr:2,3-bisphosphoglycerate-independent phosphoglycerate mutase [Patescibacteria group bacterium]